MSEEQDRKLPALPEIQSVKPSPTAVSIEQPSTSLEAAPASLSAELRDLYRARVRRLWRSSVGTDPSEAVLDALVRSFLQTDVPRQVVQSLRAEGGAQAFSSPSFPQAIEDLDTLGLWSQTMFGQIRSPRDVVRLLGGPIANAFERFEPTLDADPPELPIDIVLTGLVKLQDWPVDGVEPLLSTLVQHLRALRSPDVGYLQTKATLQALWNALAPSRYDVSAFLIGELFCDLSELADLDSDAREVGRVTAFNLSIVLSRGLDDAEEDAARAESLKKALRASADAAVLLGPAFIDTVTADRLMESWHRAERGGPAIELAAAVAYLIPTQAWFDAADDAAVAEILAATARLLGGTIERVPATLFNAGVSLLKGAQARTPSHARARLEVNLMGLWVALSHSADLPSALLGEDGLDCLVNALGAAVDVGPDVNPTIRAPLIAAGQSAFHIASTSPLARQVTDAARIAGSLRLLDAAPDSAGTTPDNAGRPLQDAIDGTLLDGRGLDGFLARASEVLRRIGVNLPEWTGWATVLNLAADRTEVPASLRPRWSALCRASGACRQAIIAAGALSEPTWMMLDQTFDAPPQPLSEALRRFERANQ